MPIIDLQRRLAEAGRIRIGQQVPTGKGGSRPEKLTTFRLTSSDAHRIQLAAQMFGGQAAPWQAPAGPQWEVVTDADALEVIVPPSDMAFSQHYELWSAGGCQRRCDGRVESISDGACVCDPDARECDIHTRLSVMLRDLPGLGVWRIDTQGYYAAVELQGAVEVIQIAAGRGQMLPARLRLEQRVVKRPGVGTRRFAVPVLDVEVSPGQLMAPASGMQHRQITGQTHDHAPVDGSARLMTPVPASLPSAPVGSVAEQAAAVAQPKARPQRKNAAQPLPATGVRPRTAAQAAKQIEPPPPPPDEPPPPEDEVHECEPTVTKAQLNKLHVLFGKFGINERADKQNTCSLLIRRWIESSTHMTVPEASRAIEQLVSCEQSSDPAKALDALIAQCQDEMQAAHEVNQFGGES
ncbi:Phage protein [Alloactinosynnema sp. L-07]|uniref:recombination directionality factor n=1 Tax=Alloactinosynnema sp. L-07 TaxID=1653480 RepID=UPI00065EFF25|nr:hypothetical protein [Alloactinosynnema sp. L-07]CRK59025.1 Phage protein [Alloactinosynnema sp. L-07]